MQEAKIRAALAVIATEIRDAADRVVNDLLKRAVFLSDDTFPTIMSWYEAHRLHTDEPYIGCPFCQDEFVPKAPVTALIERLDAYEISSVHRRSWPPVLDAVEKLRALC